MTELTIPSYLPHQATREFLFWCKTLLQDAFRTRQLPLSSCEEKGKGNICYLKLPRDLSTTVLIMPLTQREQLSMVRCV